VTCILSAEAREAYGRHRAEIAGLLDERYYPLEWVETAICEGRIALLHNDGAVLGVERRHYPGGASELHAMFAAGTLSSVLELCDQACEAGKLAGLDCAAVESRGGWEKALRSRGFVRDRVRLVKGLN
jgi:hypothetical protein